MVVPFHRLGFGVRIRRIAQESERFRQTSSAARTPALNRPGRTIQEGGCFLDRVPLDVHQNDCLSLGFWQLGQCPGDDELGLAGGDRVSRYAATPDRGRGCCCLTQGVVVGQRNTAADGTPSQPIQAGVHHDSVQPGGDRRFAAKLVGATEGGHQGVLKGVRGFVGVAGRAKSYRPESITVACDQCSECTRIPLDMGVEQFLIRGWVLQRCRRCRRWRHRLVRHGFEPTDRRRSPVGQDR